ncbi:PAS domain S-box-containing protein [Shimia isoporae]|uniref:histidine kinase n=1 Tax=Shimia isoporae TaxID=647720 RepID=A0A4R1NS72_9RHOB|nr:PAS domain-containing hybrid sensor histidine kinase/response regulator [Shimia isoporae]TCL08098.1 PAS domain S-box-containing protein [Shimia isoporae]
MKSTASRFTAASSLTAPLQFSTQPYARRVIAAALVLALATLIALSSLLSYRVITNFSGVRPEASDNVGWSLSQIEVEAGDFNNAVKDALLNGSPNLNQLRLRFDIFYSRLNTLRTSPHYKRVETIPEFSEALNKTWTYVQELVPIIDGSDDQLIASLPVLYSRGPELRENTRILSISSLTYFARAGDEDRAAITTMLLQLAGLALLLFVTLAALTGYVLSIYRKSRAREIAIAQANHRMQTVLTTSLDGVIVTDVAGNVLEFNKAAEEILGYTFDEVRGRPIVEMISPDDRRDLHLESIRRIRDGEAGTIEGKGRVTMRAKRANGEVFPIELSIQRADDGEQELFVAFMHDISKRVAAEKELLETRDKALAGERAKAEFLTMMSHEIRTPLNGVLGNLALMNDTDLTEKQTRYLRNMDISGRVLMRHVDSVLDIARFQSGELDFDIACTDLTTLLDELVASQIGQAEQHGTHLDWHWVGPPMTWGRTDRAALEQILLNLLGNAIKFTPDGNVTVEIEKMPETEGDKPIIELRVIDTGIGIATEDLDRVFDDFVTSDTSFGRQTGGTGLGLGITRRLVQGLGGTIGVESTNFEGSTFWVRLPMERGRAPGSVDAAPAPSKADQQMSVLLVEDNAINREVATELLEKDGHTVVTATDGQTGVDRAAAAHFDLILMDIAMPGMDGLQATRAIRCGDGPSRNVPIIAVSANILPQERDRFLEAGMNGFLPKPLNLNDMRLALTNLNTPIASGAVDLLDTGQLAANREGMGEAVFARLLTRFIDEVDTLVSDADRSEESQFGALTHRLHTVAGSAAVFGAAQLRQTLLMAEASMHEAAFDETAKLLAELPSVWQQTKDALDVLMAA